MKKKYMNPEVEILEADDLLLLVSSDPTTETVFDPDHDPVGKDGMDGRFDDWNED